MTSFTVRGEEENCHIRLSPTGGKFAFSEPTDNWIAVGYCERKNVE